MGFNINYNPEWHTFWHNGQRLKSISKFIADFAPPFDMDGVAEKYAIKHGMKKEDVISMWQEKGKKSAEKGTLIHKYIEDFLLKKEKCDSATALFQKDTMNALYSFLEIKMQDYDIVDVEGVVGDPELGIAGIFDCLLKSKHTGEYVLMDWKTNEKISKDNPFAVFNYPLNYLQKSDLNTYGLQLSLLNYCITKDLGIKIDKMFIIHIAEDAIHEIPVQYMMKELNKIFNFSQTQKDGKI